MEPCVREISIRGMERVGQGIFVAFSLKKACCQERERNGKERDKNR